MRTLKIYYFHAGPSATVHIIKTAKVRMPDTNHATDCVLSCQLAMTVVS